MPLITCPACKGAKVDASGNQCWGCNGHGVVEVTSDEEADVVTRGGRLIDRGTNKPGGPVNPRGAGCAPVIILAVTLAGVISWLASRGL